MRFTYLPALACATRLAAAATGAVYTYNPQADGPATPEPRSLSPEVARLVMAQRLGLEDFHSPEELDEQSISALNDYGRPSHLFGQGEGLKTAIIILESSEDDVLSAKFPERAFDIASYPSTEANEGLFVDFARQRLPAAFSSMSDDQVKEQLSPSISHPMTVIDGDMFVIAKDMDAFEQAWSTAVLSKSYSVTALLLPTHGGDKKSSWGTYSMPNAEAMLRKRQQSSTEKPLEPEPETSSTAMGSVESSTAPVTSFKSSNQSEPLPGILPACFSSKSSCESTTNNCTGHGSCSLAYTNKDVDSDSGIPCYQCACKASVEGSDEKRKTTYWSGPACQKQDVSTAFWLLALFTVGLIGLISFAVGNLVSMGSEELPSVIGAGVGGPTAKR
ncbi:hypothetical protein MBLNU230_g4423t1 [Neophaeotheca triangularis]